MERKPSIAHAAQFGALWERSVLDSGPTSVITNAVEERRSGNRSACF